LHCNLDCLCTVDCAFPLILTQGIKDHPWYKMPLSPMMEAELDAMAKEQVCINVPSNDPVGHCVVALWWCLAISIGS
jgi:hypothetical protein